MSLQSMCCPGVHRLDVPLVSVVSYPGSLLQCTHAGPLDILPKMHQSVAQVAGTLVV